VSYAIFKKSLNQKQINMKKRSFNYLFLFSLLMLVIMIISSCSTSYGGFDRKAYRKAGKGCPAQYVQQ
jgi:hypothetical protein